VRPGWRNGCYQGFQNADPTLRRHFQPCTLRGRKRNDSLRQA